MKHKIDKSPTSTNLRKELEKRQLQVNAGKAMEHSDVAQRIFYICEQIKQNVKILRKNKEIGLYQGGVLTGRESVADEIQDYILGKIKEGDEAKKFIEEKNLTQDRIAQQSKEEEEAIEAAKIVSEIRLLS